MIPDNEVEMISFEGSQQLRITEGGKEYVFYITGKFIACPTIKPFRVGIVVPSGQLFREGEGVFSLLKKAAADYVQVEKP